LLSSSQFNWQAWVRLLRAVDDIPKALEGNLFFHLTDSTSATNDHLQAKKGAVSIESISLDRVFFQREGLKIHY
jgi:hypothetical protein